MTCKDPIYSAGGKTAYISQTLHDAHLINIVAFVYIALNLLCIPVIIIVFAYSYNCIIGGGGGAYCSDDGRLCCMYSRQVSAEERVNI